MKLRVLASVSLLVALLLGAAGAQAAEEDRLTVTFELTLYGEAPESDTFRVSYSACPYNDACPDVAMAATFCGSYQAEFLPVEPGREVCEGGGRVYRATVEDVRPGWAVSYSFVRIDEGSSGEEFRAEGLLRGPEKRLYEDMTVRASYSYGAGDGQGTVPEELPRSGGGGAGAGG